MEIRHKKVEDMTSVEYRACYLANYGPENGLMAEELSLCRQGWHDGRAIMLWDGPDDSVRSLIGWALLTPVRKTGYLAVTDWVMKRSKYTVQFWVKSQYRRRGYGSILMTEAKKLDPRPHVIPHDEKSSELFSSFEVQVLRDDKRWIKRKPKIS